MGRISQFLMDNVSNLTSARSISDTLTSNKDKINHKTVCNYLNYLCNAFAFYKFRRYDIKGKKYLASGSGQTVRDKPNGINCLICRITLCVFLRAIDLPRVSLTCSVDKAPIIVYNKIT